MPYLKSHSHVLSRHVMCHVTCHVSCHVTCYVPCHVSGHVKCPGNNSPNHPNYLFQRVKVIQWVPQGKKPSQPVTKQTSVPCNLFIYSCNHDFLFWKSIFRLKTKNSPTATTTHPSVRLKKWYVHFENGIF